MDLNPDKFLPTKEEAAHILRGFEAVKKAAKICLPTTDTEVHLEDIDTMSFARVYYKDGDKICTIRVDGIFVLTEAIRILMRATHHPGYKIEEHEIKALCEEVEKAMSEDLGRELLEKISPEATIKIPDSVTYDSVDYPKHYVSHPSGIEQIQISRHMCFNLGNVIKYIWRADLKGNDLEDLRKARFYLDDEIKRRGG